MIIQFNPSPDRSGAVSVPVSQSRSYDVSHGRHDPSEQTAASLCVCTDEDCSKISDFELAYPEEPTLFPNYVEEVEPKQFKSSKSVTLFAAEELSAANQVGEPKMDLGRWIEFKVLQVHDETAVFQSLPDAA